MTSEPATSCWPVEIRVISADRCLEIDFDNGDCFSIPAELLRVESPSAEIQGHGPDQKRTIGGCRNVGIAGVEPIGNYAVRIRFDDGHDTGLYSWRYLHDLGSRQHSLWDDYIRRLAEQGLKRDP